ncbi:Na-translocating system protein MpsC family protein [Cohnella candidum]|uniref:DUF2294 family protein n=1 Tax=Cohnella candidum TaxID=2674991 RepID=A0A3G3K4S4_9BACL|nr:Na-translocating system protein MpsC family protein [Cohnella candidum]AYQ75171.1 DUF2294 family protein [Cohnella candidum]
MPMTPGKFKQEVLKHYNDINKKIFNTGVKRQDLEWVGNKLLFISINARLPLLKILDEHDPEVITRVHKVLHDRVKEELKEMLESIFDLRVAAILKDYDVMTEYSGTIVILERDVQEYLKDTPEL